MMLPPKFEDRLINKIGIDAFKAYKDRFDAIPVTSIRLNSHKSSNHNLKNSVPWCPLGFYLDARPIFTLDPAFHAGAYYVQEASSMFVWHALENLGYRHKNLNILDLCAAPGGKNTLIANWLDGDGLLCSNDPIKNRAYTLKYNIMKEGYSNVVVTNNDPKHFGQINDFFDIILVDAPCSGEGMFRKDPDTINEWSEEHVNFCAARQKRIVTDVLPSLKAGGYLIYSTCTFNESENIDNVAWMCAEYGLKSVDIDIDPSWGICKEQKGLGIGFQFYPQKVQGEGFFIAILQKDDDQKVSMNLKQNKQLLTAIHKKDIPILESFITTKNPLFLEDKMEQVHMIPKALEPQIYILNHYLRIIYLGIHMGKLNKNILIPDHSLALAIEVSPSINRIELDKMDSLLYLKKTLPAVSSDANGWLLATYHHNPIGWFKNLQHRINNYLPSEYRIIMDIPKDFS